MIVSMKLPESIQNMPEYARVWIYQSDRPFSAEELTEISRELAEFVASWTAHSVQLAAGGFVAEDRCIVFVVDESAAGASGCSIDTSVHFVQSLEKKYGVRLFDRMIIYHQLNDAWHLTNLHQLRDDITAGRVSPDTQVINPLVQNKQAFEHGFITAVRDCWIGDLVLE